MGKKTPAELHFDETTGNWTLGEGKSEEFCRDGKPHAWKETSEVCRVCGITRLEYTMRYGP